MFNVATAPIGPEMGAFLPELYQADYLRLDPEQRTGLVSRCGAYAQEVQQILGQVADARSDVLARLRPGRHITEADMRELDTLIDARMASLGALDRAYIRAIRDGYLLLSEAQVTAATEHRHTLAQILAARGARAVGVEPVHI